jgi:hypothetical protein
MRKVITVSLSLASIPVIAGVLVAALALGVGAPHAAASPVITHHTAPRIHVHDGQRESTSTNWSGFATTGTTYSTVQGAWTQPSVTCGSGETSYSSFWVGIDGDTTNTVEQTGTDSDCSSGTPTYYAWYEMYPKFPVNLSNPVAAGDSLSASVTFNGGGSFTLTISDSTQGWTFTTKQSSKKARRGSAEWIAEAPSGSGGVLPLADFGTVSFSGCSANGLSISSNPNPDAITMVTSGGQTKAAPSALGSGGTAFSVTWQHS